jgi:hypothetical protein
MLNAIEDIVVAREKAIRVIEKPRGQHWRRIRTNNPLEESTRRGPRIAA